LTLCRIGLEKYSDQIYILQKKKLPKYVQTSFSIQVFNTNPISYELI